MLKSLGAATALSTVGVPVSATGGEPTLEEIVDRSHRVLQAAGPEKQHEFLRNRGVGTAMDSATWQVPTGTNDGVSIEWLSMAEISLSFSLYTDCSSSGYANGTYIAELSWQYDASIDDWGASPDDFVGIAWDENTWYYEDNNLSDIDENSGQIEYYSGSSGEGPAWSVYDEATIDNGYEFDGQDYYWVNVDIVWTGQDHEMDNKTIAASYSHTWSDVTITGVGVSYPAGVTVSVSNETQEWTKDYNNEGDFLRLSHDEVTHTCSDPRV